ncbi:MAG TPA: hypothetical protein DET40_06510 [Lentisphaeria bacterium]|nr:MAG: hypothetical protein A2X45_17615 [Lentisphaerae bacterium GWF2_50_93]HCE43180.1 hypothetical protein [Lentisphaeria bacterium]
MEPRKISDFIDRLIHVEGIDFPELVLRPDSLECEIGQGKLILQPAEFALFWMLAIRCKHSLPPIRGISSLLEEFKAFSSSVSSAVMPEINSPANFADFTENEVMRAIETLSAKISSVISDGQGLEYILPGKGNSSFSLIMPSSKIFCPRNY